MRSKTKSRFRRSTIEALVRDQFGSSVGIASIHPLSDGWFNSAYAISFSDAHPDVVLRIAPDPQMRLLSYEKGLMRSEVKTYQFVQQNLSIPLPRLYGYNFKRNITNRDYMFIARMSGDPLNKVIGRIEQKNIDSLEYDLGSFAARIHSLTGQRFGYIGDESGDYQRSWRESFLNMVFSLLDDATTLSVKLPAACEDIRALYTNLSYVLSDIEKPSLVHWDLWPPNIFVVPENGRYVIEGITDWERAFWGDPEAELVMLRKSPGSPFFRGYGKELTGGQSAAIRRCLYLTHLWLVVIIEARVRFENAPHVEWAYTSLERDLQTLRGYLE